MWIDNKKTYNMVPQKQIMDSIKMYKIYDEVIKFIDNTNWRVGLTAEGKS